MAKDRKSGLQSLLQDLHAKVNQNVDVRQMNGHMDNINP